MIMSHPSSNVVDAGTDVTFTVSATGGQLVYQWRKDGVELEGIPSKYSGIESNSLRILSVNDPDDEGMYSVRVANMAGTTDSNSAQLTIGKQMCVS